MKNMSKKTRKKVMRIIKANCHSNDGCWWEPYKSSRMFAIWKHIITEDRLALANLQQYMRIWMINFLYTFMLTSCLLHS